MPLIAIGAVLGPHGTAGEIKVRPLTDFPERFQGLGAAYLAAGDPPQGDTVVHVEGTRPHRGCVVVKLKGYDSRQDAEGLKGFVLALPEEQLMPLPADHYYIFQIIGLEVLTTEGEHLGVVRDVLRTGSNDVYVVRGIGGERKGERVPGPEGVLEPDRTAEPDRGHGRKRAGERPRGRRRTRARQREILIPATREVVREVDLTGKRLVIEPLPGLLD